MSHPKLSVIIPIYNVEKYLRQCVNSVLKQTYADLEVILIDDGSTDSCTQICDEFVRRDDRVKVLHKKNEGLISARYEGVYMATADYVAFVDGDDWISGDMYQDLMGIMCEYHVDLVTSGWISYWPDGDMKLYWDKHLKEGFYDYGEIKKYIFPIMLWDFKLQGYGFGSAVWSKIFHRELLIKQYQTLGRYHFFYGEDVAVTYPYLLDSRSVYVTYNKHYYYRQREKGAYPACFSKNSYFDELFLLYQYLRQKFENSEYEGVLKKQLDYFYMSCVQKRKWGYHDVLSNRLTQYLFPFGQVPAESRIVLYGAGEVGHQYYRQIKETGYCNIAGWVDLNYKNYETENVLPITKITEIEFDYIVIANAMEKIREQIKNTLSDMGIDTKKIIWHDVSKAG